MKHLLLLIIGLFPHFFSQAQDTLWTTFSYNDIPYITVESKDGESVYTIAKKYTVPPGFFADLNGIGLQEPLIPATKLKVPVGSYNYRRVADTGSNRPLFYRVKQGDRLHDIARAFNTAQRSIQLWNDLPDQTIIPGQALITGWISYDRSQEPAGTGETQHDDAEPKITNSGTDEDTATDSIQSSLETKYFEANNGSMTEEESGAAVFFDTKAAAKPGLYYAFHNIAERGSVIRVYNPDGGKTIYVKVIGRIPELKEYHNCIIAISGNAAAALGTAYKRMFCKISY